ncbi:hypothetical protein [Paenibacillus sp.]|jgi:hypothetical protein|uniref:hypothetical protein n=1 Tax=Paenibacillus sp. TaxID=58172 RepID=UPI00282C8B55|nr:hypothetical protein [Paenibacillus sp.]MDR0269488.1 hypothetical protein [Paenibacillus sp.]
MGELSIASPVQNSSGAVTSILLFIFFTHKLGVVEVLGVAIITLGVIGIAILEKAAEQRALKASSEQIDKKYQIGMMRSCFRFCTALLMVWGLLPMEFTWMSLS